MSLQDNRVRDSYQSYQKWAICVHEHAHMWKTDIEITVRYFIRYPKYPTAFCILTGSPRDMIFQLATQRSVAVGEKWHQNVYPPKSTSAVTSELRYSYRVICDENYFGDNCSEFCKPRDDKFGHYICGADGARVCLDGWKGDYCDEGKPYRPYFWY